MLTLSWGSKRIDTKVSILLGLQFPLLDNMAKIGEARPLRKGERQLGYPFVGARIARTFLYLYAVSDSLLLHIRFHLRRRDIAVSRNSLALWLWTAPAGFI